MKTQRQKFVDARRPRTVQASRRLASIILTATVGATACEQLEPEPENVATSRHAVGNPAEAEIELGKEVSVPRHLADGEEFGLTPLELIDHGQLMFAANWTPQEGGGRPLTTGTGVPLADPSSPLLFPRNFNRISAPDANSCAGCHNAPFGVPGGGGDIVANVFVLGHRFDFATFDHSDTTVTRGALAENGEFATLDDIANSRATLGMFGSGYIEMLTRQITADLQVIRDSILPGGEAELTSKGISYGTLRRNIDGTWDVSDVEGLPPPALQTSGASSPPSLVIHPFHQAGAVVSLRQFTNNAFNHHHGIQSTERFGDNVDQDGDGFFNEATRADITAASVYQATLPPPGRVIPRHPVIEQAVALGEQLFEDIGCASCHIQSLPLDNEGWIFTEPNPYNPPGNVQPGEGPELAVDLNDSRLPSPRLRDKGGIVVVQAYTDFKLHDITSGPDDPNVEPLNMHFPPGSNEFFAGNRRFITKKLWGAANEPPFFHHGKFTTMREAILAHAGEAQATTDAFIGLSDHERDSIIEFLKSLQVLPLDTPSLIVDEHGQPRNWRPERHLP